MIFAYKGISNKKKSGYVYADSKKEAIQILKEEGIVAIYYLEERFNNPTLNRVREFVSNEKEKITDRFQRVEGKSDKKEEKKLKLPTRKELSNFVDKNLRKKPTEITIDKELYQDITELFNQEDISYSMDNVDSFGQEINTFNTGRSFGKGEIDWDLIDTEREDIETEKLKIKRKEVIMFTKRLKMMLVSGIELPRALNILHDSPNENMKKMIEGLLLQIQDGESLAKAMAKYPNQFDETYITLVEIGENSGTLTDILQSLAEYMESRENIYKKVKNALIYPVIVTVVLTIAIVIASVFLIPTFQEIFEDMAGDEMALPTITNVVFGIAGAVPYIVVVGIILFIIIKILRSKITNVDRFFKKNIDQLILKTPIIKNISLTSNMHMISSTIGLMVDSGISINNAVSAVRGTVKNVFIKNDLGRISYLMDSESFSLSESLREQENIDQLLTSMALTGEESGEMSQVLRDASDYYDQELNAMMSNAMEALPHVVVIIMAIIVVPFLFAMFLPLLDLQTAMPI